MSQPVHWSHAIYELFKSERISQVAFVPDAGHTHLIRLVEADPTMRGIVLTTEEEGVALAVGAHLGGQRAVLLMQSSGVGNCINMLSAPRICGAPFLTLVTMRGEWGEFNPWQVPMGQAAPTVLKAMGVVVYTITEPSQVRPTVEAAIRLAFSSYVSVAVLLSQQLLGAKSFDTPQPS